MNFFVTASLARQLNSRASCVVLARMGPDGNFEVSVERANYSVISISYLARSLFKIPFFCELPNFVN